MNDSKIKMIRSMPDGDRLIVLWIGILCLGMKSGRPGMVEIGDGIPFTSETLSVELNIPLTTVRLGLKTFTQLRMIEIWKNSEMFIVNFEKHQSLEKIRVAAEISRKSSKKFRQKMKALPQIVTVTSSSHCLGDGHVTESDETDKEEEKEQTQQGQGPASEKEPNQILVPTAKTCQNCNENLDDGECPICGWGGEF